MADSDFPILVVDDAKFSSAIIAKVLRAGGFENARFTNNPQEALRSLEKRSVQVVIADWYMPAMDGLELAQRIRKIDADEDHHTFIILMTSRDDVEPLGEAFEAGVDDFINKANIRDQLLPRVMAATRQAQRLNDLLKENRHLGRQVHDLKVTDLVDPVTGLGNRKFTLDRLTATLQQSESRGGTACLLQIGINNLDVVSKQFDASSINEIMLGMSSKIRTLVRPMDMITRPADNMFAVITLQENLKNCTNNSFKRIFDNLYMHSFRTSEGYVPVVIGISIGAADSTTGFPNAEDFFEFTEMGLKQSFETGIVAARAFDPTRLLARV